MKDLIEKLKELHPDNPVLQNRTTMAMIREWCAHNLLYKLGILRSHTVDVDLDWPQKWYISLAYAVFGTMAMIFVKKA